MRSDNGPQFKSEVFETSCESLEVEYERIPYKTPNMNAYKESYHRILGDGCLGINEFESFAEARCQGQTVYKDENLRDSIKTHKISR
ncbi:hypothetical protein Q428_14380 [Fervidicella metallireducens AeB]|uniref:Integrase catalytic domain-containing protein n=1 Tax=Fervidicella metallireducens AeB TaxID=1403537 RepID=A0A017RTL1_9CLOT|nr:hypothetical protein [Fervidicella metallireducens]EYE87240.1 hypothetical protein Q428_14380 [Fervidicella metallireducens AeB]